MTAFEGLADARELADQLVDYRHKYLAITDKFNCQVFTSIYNYNRYGKKDIKSMVFNIQTINWFIKSL